MKKILVFILIILFIIPLNTNAKIEFGGSILDKSVESESYYKYTDNFTKSEKELIYLVNYYKFLKDKTNKELFLQKIQIKKSYKTKYDTLLKSIDNKLSSMNNSYNMMKIVNILDKKLESRIITQNNRYILNYLRLSIIDKQMNLFLTSPENILKEYNLQLKKARDTNRISDITSIENGIQQFYRDNSYYPNIDEINTKLVGPYIYNLPKEELGNVEINSCKFGYRYILSNDKKNYELSTCLENSDTLYSVSSNIDEKINGNEIYIDGFTNWNKYDYSISNIKIESKQGSIFINGKNIDDTYDYNDWLDYYENDLAETRDLTRYLNLKNIKTSLELEFIYNGIYPDNINSILSKFNVANNYTNNGLCNSLYYYSSLDGGKNYIISTCVESKYWLNEARYDGGYDDKKLEIGSNIKSSLN